MRTIQRKDHWENIYQTKELETVSWYQKKPTTSLDFLDKYKVSKTAKIIDVGGGDSYFVDNLLQLGYEDISVLDISEFALNRAKTRLGQQATTINWITADASNFTPNQTYDFWHDRAAFHFLTQEDEINNYINTVYNYLNPGGVLVLGTFSKNGPTKCSGIEIRQYSENSMTERLNQYFDKIDCINLDHKTPFGTLQNFTFCSFKKLNT